MKVLVACEFSGVVRRAFSARGHDAWSCDLLPADDGADASGKNPAGNHYTGDIMDGILEHNRWDLLLAFPPCTYLCSSGLHWNTRIPGRQEKTEDALKFVQYLLNADVPRIALENPIGCISTRIRRPDQTIQPWMFGHPESKSTCLWLKNLPKLVPTNVLQLPESGRWANQTPSGQNRLGPSADRWKLRSITYAGIAEAMAEQWGIL